MVKHATNNCKDDGSTPSVPKKSSVVQVVDHSSVKRSVVGSNPTWREVKWRIKTMANKNFSHAEANNALPGEKSNGE